MNERISLTGKVVSKAATVLHTCVLLVLCLSTLTAQLAALSGHKTKAVYSRLPLYQFTEGEWTESDPSAVVSRDMKSLKVRFSLLRAINSDNSGGVLQRSF